MIIISLMLCTLMQISRVYKDWELEVLAINK